ncbi:phenol hydroxylase [halophilic archaeon]|nr:phenol hydroxylase [halophilic archaeon]
MRDVEITSIHQMTPSVKQFEVVADEPFEYRPGQHTHLHFERDESESAGDDSDDGGSDDADGDSGDDSGEVVRPYTATSLPGTDTLTLAIRRYDDGTASVYMHDRDPGDTVRIEDLDGNLYLRDRDADVTLVSTGTGITPMIAMLKQYLEEGSGDVYFLYGEKTQEDVMYRETLDQFEADHENLTVVYSLSEEDWDGPTGHVQEHLADAVPDVSDTDCYVCGVPEMVVETKDRLAELGVPDDRVYSEGWEDDEVADE